MTRGRINLLQHIVFVEPLVYPMKIGVRCSQLWISSRVRPPQHPLSNLLIYLFSWGVKPPLLQRKPAGGLRARPPCPFYEYRKSDSVSASVRGD